MRILFENEQFACLLDEEIPCVMVQYRSFQTVGEMEANVDRASDYYDALQDVYHPLYWLSDNRDQLELDPEVIHWANETWLPRMVQLGLSRIALVYRRQTMAALSLDEFSKNAMLDFPGGRLEVAYFASLEDAREWLAG
ncbi:MAG: hypothetical protein LW884_03965 [Bacteroidetes bacterium]|jgi:hypothetical protein|nr:hypothetical protein [Bacteroidota bacterium]